MSSECRTLDMLQQPGPPALLVSLPANDPDLALAARDAGAQGLKVHLNIQHAAAGVRFGSLDEEAHSIERIVGLGLPVGVVPGDQNSMASQADICQLAGMGVDFVDAYVEAMPAWLLVRPPLGLMVAAGPNEMHHPQRLDSLSALPTVQMVEASIIPHQGYGHPLSVADLADYTTVIRRLTPAGLPVMVPTQRRIPPEDLPALAATGIRALLIGAIVTGTDAGSIAAATGLYRRALAELS